MAGTAVVMLLALTVYEGAKQLMVPGIIIWQSHLTTIVVGTALATAIAHLVQRKQASGTLLHYEDRVENLSEQRRVEAAQRRLVAILEATPDLVAITQVKGPASYVNPAG